MSANNKFLEKIAGAPAAVLDKTIDTSKQITEGIAAQKHIGQAKQYWKAWGQAW